MVLPLPLQDFQLYIHISRGLTRLSRCYKYSLAFLARKFIFLWELRHTVHIEKKRIINKADDRLLRTAACRPSFLNRIIIIAK